MSNKKDRTLDPRTGIILIILSVFIVFAHTSLYIEWIFVGSILVLMYVFGIKSTMMKMLGMYLLLTCIQVLVIPNVNVTIASILSVFIYFKMIFPCGAMAALFCSITSVRALLEAFRRMHIPNSVSIAFAVSMRYFPILKEEVSAIWHAMCLRNIKGVEQKIEGMYVPLLMSAVKTGEELAQSAIIRGVESPVAKTSLFEIKFRVKDMIAIIYFVLLAVIAFLVR
ncbi:energy-coupling factor transporter transmembrane component T family protein [Cellulosilyticum ruminicola]|uniref:energy-coupling factor transporter transmembrane component T family protein n=1 Tax=Cellulosilyticum ruminicola TaxID=425254 RepID=UPI0006D0725D|nr:energy-coupling factor transporter transmembrane component T [Cellulosilyticum ruminicola]